MKIEQSPISTTLLGLAIILGMPILGAASTDTKEKHIIGWIETVQILPEDFSLSAKIDTGADHSSLNVIQPMEFMKGEKKWIRFSIPMKGDETKTLVRPIMRFALIKRKGAPVQKRAVVLFNLCVGNLYKKNVPVNLANRTGFKYPMLIGRSFLKGSAIVDADLTLTQEPACSAPMQQ
jgi:hypothetical protein